jgi:hypothetical protein
MNQNNYNNKITFTNKLEGMKAALIITLMMGKSYPYVRNIFNISKGENGMTVYFSSEYFNALEVIKIDGKNNLL